MTLAVKRVMPGIEIIESKYVPEGEFYLFNAPKNIILPGVGTATADLMRNKMYQAEYLNTPYLDKEYKLDYGLTKEMINDAKNRYYPVPGKIYYSEDLMGIKDTAQMLDQIYIPATPTPQAKDARLEIKQDINKEIARQNARAQYLAYIKDLANNVYTFAEPLTKQDKKELKDLLLSVVESI